MDKKICIHNIQAGVRPLSLSDVVLDSQQNELVSSAPALRVRMGLLSILQTEVLRHLAGIDLSILAAGRDPRFRVWPGLACCSSSRRSGSGSGSGSGGSSSRSS